MVLIAFEDFGQRLFRGNFRRDMFDTSDVYNAERWGWLPVYGDYMRHKAQTQYNRQYERFTGKQPAYPWLGGSGGYSNTAASQSLGRIFNTGAGMFARWGGRYQRYRRRMDSMRRSYYAGYGYRALRRNIR